MSISCVAYQSGIKLAELSIGEVEGYLQRLGCFVWVSLSDATDAELDAIQERFGLHDLVVEDARHGYQRPKIEEYDEALFVAMHMVAVGESGLDIGEVCIYAEKSFVISLRSRSKQHFSVVRERCEREPELLRLGASFVLYALMDAVVDSYFPVIDYLESKLEIIEEHLFDKGTARSNIEQLYELKRKVQVLKHAVTPMMEAVGKLHGGRVPPVCTEAQEYFRDIHDHLTRINSGIDTMRDTISTAIMVCQSTVTIEQNEVNKKLAAWAAIFAMATVFTGVWGMNFQRMPELQWEYGYFAALLAITAVCGFIYRHFKRSGWL